ncbi:rRNA maturation RNase YbeY [Vagococcus lutrae]|uniref:rRNA maturation RNase YbeY n=1 Tax=Vagococcus lutrae TaxID=81947 RepID=UPI0023A91522|nr:rRNA maturation RNase YbeY [Vagococcus lutrae]WEB82175.1 rRNA maturation RNase YbeY [Vagococcus lutrae]
MEVSVIDQTESLSTKDIEQILSLLEHAANYLDIEPEAELSLTFMDNQAIQVYNRDYRGKDVATDVISFAIEDDVEGLEMMSELGIPRNLGDILISTEKAKEQALEYGHSEERELGFLALHGFLHLNGYDHMTPEDEAEMFGLQRKILDSYGLSRS